MCIRDSTAALSTDNLAKEYFGDEGMLGYVKGVQEKKYVRVLHASNIKIWLDQIWEMIIKNILLERQL